MYAPDACAHEPDHDEDEPYLHGEREPFCGSLVEADVSETRAWITIAALRAGWGRSDAEAMRPGQNTSRCACRSLETMTRVKRGGFASIVHAHESRKMCKPVVICRVRLERPLSCGSPKRSRKITPEASIRNNCNRGVLLTGEIRCRLQYLSTQSSIQSDRVQLDDVKLRRPHPRQLRLQMPPARVPSKSIPGVTVAQCVRRTLPTRAARRVVGGVVANTCSDATGARRSYCGDAPVDVRASRSLRTPST